MMIPVTCANLFLLKIHLQPLKVILRIIECVVKKASDLLGMYVGETEQNIACAFRQAEVEGTVLVIDETDSFIYSRDTSQRS